MHMAGHHPPVEEYLELVLELEESGVPPMRARLVERLGVSAPAVSETVGRLEREGYVVLDPARVIQLTKSGRVFATSIMRRHRLAERLLVDVIGVPWSQVHEEAGRLEHAISPTLEPYLVALLGDPATCPHGNPIPGSANAVEAERLVPLSAVAVGGRAVVRRIDEELEAQLERMRELERLGLLPGCHVRVDALVDGVLVLELLDERSGSVRLDATVAARVYVGAVPHAAADVSGGRPAVTAAVSPAA